MLVETLLNVIRLGQRILI